MVSRKTIILSCSILVFAAGILSAADNSDQAAGTIPECTIPGVFTVDTKTEGIRTGSTVKITGYARTVGTEFTVSAYDEKTSAWVTAGTAKIKGFSDTEKVKNGSLSKSRYVAIAASDGGEFTYTVNHEDGTLLFTVYDKGADVTKAPLPYLKRQRAYVFDAKQLENKYDNYIKVDSKTNDPDIKFEVYVYDPKAYKWLDYGTGVLKEFGDSDTVNTDADIDIDEYRYFAVESMNEKDYSYTVNAVHENVIMDNIHIEVRDQLPEGTVDALN
jgi:hypothetical protein